MSYPETAATSQARSRTKTGKLQWPVVEKSGPGQTDTDRTEPRACRGSLQSSVRHESDRLAIYSIRWRGSYTRENHHGPNGL